MCILIMSRTQFFCKKKKRADRTLLEEIPKCSNHSLSTLRKAYQVGTKYTFQSTITFSRIEFSIFFFFFCWSFSPINNACTGKKFFHKTKWRSITKPGLWILYELKTVYKLISKFTIYCLYWHLYYILIKKLH